MGPDRCDANVLIVGGGATAAGVAHDLAPRGLRVTLVEPMTPTPGVLLAVRA